MYNGGQLRSVWNPAQGTECEGYNCIQDGDPGSLVVLCTVNVSEVGLVDLLMETSGGQSECVGSHPWMSKSWVPKIRQVHTTGQKNCIGSQPRSLLCTPLKNDVLLSKIWWVQDLYLDCRIQCTREVLYWDSQQGCPTLIDECNARGQRLEDRSLPCSV